MSIRIGQILNPKEEAVMPGCWVMRTDRDQKEFLWHELKNGRLRQGWGYDATQDLGVILDAVQAGKPLTPDQTKCRRGNRRMLSSEPDGIQPDDIIVVPHLPEVGMWSIVRVVGPYRYEISESQGDYGHILPVELLTKNRAVNPYEGAVSARLRQTMRTRIRLWNINSLEAEVQKVLDAIQAGDPGDSLAKHLPQVLKDLQRTAWEALGHHYQGPEFEEPCVMLLKALYGEDNVEHTSGRGERGADVVCHYADPLGVEHRLVVQVKMWQWEMNWTRPLQQIEEAYAAYEGITAGAILSTSERMTPEFEAAWAELETRLRIPIRVVLREDLLRLFIAHLPDLVADSDTPTSGT
jgi:hypothetical protein